MNTTLTPTSLALFLDYAEDAGHWAGTPLVGGNVPTTRETRGNISDLVMKGLISISKSEGDSWLFFTDQGIEFADQFGINLSWIDKHNRG